MTTITHRTALAASVTLPFLCRSRASPRLLILSGNLAGDLDGTLIRNMLAGAAGLVNA